MSPNQKYTQPRNVRPKISSNPDTEPLEFETFQPKNDQVAHQNLHPEILQAEDLIFDNDRIHPVNHRVIPISINTLPNEKQKLLIVIAALRMGYRETDPVRIRNRVIRAARRKIHYTCGLPEPAKYLRCTESLIRSYLKAEAYGEEDLLPIQHKRNRKSKIQKILEMHPQLLHKVWRKAVKTIGMAASFAR